MGLFLLLRDLVRALVDLLAGQGRRRFEHAIEIAAPPALVWDMLKARDIVFEGLVPLRVRSEPVPGRPNHESVHILAGTTELRMLTRIVDERPGRAILYQVLPEGTEPALVEGADDYVGFVLTETRRGTRLDLTREATPVRWLSRLTIPVGLRSGAGRYKRKAEAMARAAAPEASGA